MKFFRYCCRLRFIRRYINTLSGSSSTSDMTELWGLRFKNRIGLAAGFDKNALYLRELETLGFGHVEIGTVTPLAQQGNERPRLFRLTADKALINRMGFNNDGAIVVAARLRKWRAKEKKNPQKDVPGMIIGGNIGKNKVTPNEEAWKDYVSCMQELFDVVDYFVVNISSPNTPGLRALQDKEALGVIIDHLQRVNRNMAESRSVSARPLLVKIAPDLTEDQIQDIVRLSEEKGLAGIVATNTTLDRTSLGAKGRKKAEEKGAGGLSGKPLGPRSTEVLRQIRREALRLPVIASGGIFTDRDAREKMEAGASLMQVWTGFIYEGPLIVRKILRGLGANADAGSAAPSVSE